MVLMHEGFDEQLAQNTECEFMTANRANDDEPQPLVAEADKGKFGDVVQLDRAGDTRRQWTIKGLSPEAIEQTRDAARKSGLKLNAWISDALRRAAEEPARDSRVEQPDRAAELEERLKSMEIYIKEEFEVLRQRSLEIEKSMKNINAFLVKIYAEKD